MSITDLLRERVVGKRVVAVEDAGARLIGARLILDDGTTLMLYMSESDCCASAEGKWVVAPGALEAIITDARIDFDAARSGYDGDTNVNYATIAVLHNQNPVALADCYASAGNGGYYFSVLSLRIEMPELGRFGNLELGIPPSPPGIDVPFLDSGDGLLGG